MGERGRTCVGEFKREWGIGACVEELVWGTVHGGALPGHGRAERAWRAWERKRGSVRGRAHVGEREWGSVSGGACAGERGLSMTALAV